MSPAFFKFNTRLKNISMNAYFVVSSGTEIPNESKSLKRILFLSSTESTVLPALMAGGRGEVILDYIGVDVLGKRF